MPKLRPVDGPGKGGSMSKSNNDDFVLSQDEVGKVRAAFSAAGKVDSVKLYDAVVESLARSHAAGLELARDYARYYEYVRPDFGTDLEVAETCGFTLARAVQLIRVGKLIIKGGRIPENVSFSELAEITAARKTWSLSDCETFLANFAGKRTCAAIRKALKDAKAAEKAAGSVKIAAETLPATKSATVPTVSETPETARFPETVIDGHAVEICELPATDPDVAAVVAALSGNPDALAAFARLRDKYGF